MRSIKKAFHYLLNPTSRINQKGSTEKVLPNNENLASPNFHGRGLKLRHFWQSPLLLMGVLILSGLLVVVLFGPFMVDFDPYITTQAVLPHYDSEAKQMIIPPFPPSAEHPLGTDDFGNDLLSLIIYGSRVTLVAAAYVTLIRMVLGVVIGSIAGWNAEGRSDRVIMAIVGGVASVPLLLSGVILLLAMDIRNGVYVFIIGLSVIGWTETAQFVRSETMLIRKKPYMEAAVATGLTELQMVVRHALPNLLPMLLVIAALEMGAVLLLLAELGFLGIYIGGGSRFAMDPIFGGQPQVLVPVPEWGGLVAKGAGAIRTSPHLAIFPALGFVVSILGLNFLGEGLRQLLQRSNVNTSYLLSKQMALFTAALITISAIVIQRTGPAPSYGRLAAGFDMERVEGHIDVMAQNDEALNPADAIEANLDYIAQYFRENELIRGWRPGINTSYRYEDNGQIAIIGFLPGYDFDLSPELLTVIFQVDAAGQSDGGMGNYSLAAMLELVRLYHEKQFDPRRSILFIAWYGDQVDAEQYLEYRGNFTPLPVPVNFPQVYQTAIFHVDLSGGGDTLWLDPASDRMLLGVMGDSASQANMPLLEADNPPRPGNKVNLSQTSPSLSMQLSIREPGAASDGSGIAEASQSLAITLMKLANQPHSWVDDPGFFWPEE